MSVIIPDICGFTATSLRGSILPVMTEVLRMSFTVGVISSYSTVLGRDCIQRNTKVPMNTMAMKPATMSLKYFFIDMSCCFVLFVDYVYSSLIASTGLMFIARSAGAKPANMPNTINMATAPKAVQKSTW